MAAKRVTLTRPSCGLSKEVPAEKIPPLAVNATCRACGQIFPIADQVTPIDPMIWSCLPFADNKESAICKF